MNITLFFLLQEKAMKPVNLLLAKALKQPLMIAFLLTSIFVVTAIESPAQSCTEELVSLSPCLPYIASPPNDLASWASSLCCDRFSSALQINGSACLCYLLRQPLLLGFPLNTSRILSVSSDCNSKNENSTSTNFLQSLCEGMPTLPPLQSISGSGNSTPPLTANPPEIAAPPTPTNSSSEPSSNSSTLAPVDSSRSSSSSQILPGVLLFLVPILMCLYHITQYTLLPSVAM